MSQARALRLLAQDNDDLAVISAALQDAVLKVGDIAVEPLGRRLTMSVNRYRWEGGVRERVRSALQVGDVLKVQARGIAQGRKGGVLELLAVGFEPLDAPGGRITFTFAGGGDLAVDVDCLDVAMADVSTPWPTKRAPAHRP